MTGKRVNRGVVLGPDIPVNYFFNGDARVITWSKKRLEKLERASCYNKEMCQTKICSHIFFIFVTNHRCPY